MKLSYSLLDHYETCQFRTKLFDFERVERVDGASDKLRSLIGDFAHTGQKALILGQDVRTELRRAAWKIERAALPPDFVEQWPAARIVDRACGMVARFSRSVPSFDYRDLEPLVYDQDLPDGATHTPLVDAKLWVPLDPPIGIFKSLVLKPDLVCTNKVTGHTWLYDWKWAGALDEPDAFRYDLQSVIYQWGLKQLGIKVVGHAIVQGLIEEPTPFKVTKKGAISRAAVRNSWEEYERVCRDLGQPADETMRAKLAPMFRHHTNFRSLKEVEAVWHETIVPKALAISRSAVSSGFPRRWAKFICTRCPVREDCSDGQLQHHEDRRFNSIYLAAEVK